jgi:hypothetical protein
MATRLENNRGAKSDIKVTEFVRFVRMSVVLLVSYPSGYSLLPFSSTPHLLPLLPALPCSWRFGSAAWNCSSRNSGCSVWCTAFGCSSGGLTNTTNAGGLPPPVSTSAFHLPAKVWELGSTVQLQHDTVQPRTNGLGLVRPVYVSTWSVLTCGWCCQFGRWAVCHRIYIYITALRCG